MNVYDQAIQSLQQSRLRPSLIANAVEIVPTIPLSMEGQPYCKACESVLCGACGDCHSLDMRISDPICPNDNDTMGANCAAWWQAHHTVWCILYEQHREQRGD